MLSTGICRWLFLLISLSTWTKLIDSKEMRIICYYTNWSIYRPGQAKFSPQNINPYLCTHLVYAFGGFTKENTLKPFDKYQDIEKGGYAKFTGLKTYNKNLKTLIAIGGWNEGSSRFSPMVASAERRKELVKNTIKFLRQNHFDGLDLDWEYPTFRDGGKNRDRDNYAHLVQELREEFERESEKTGRPRLLLTMAVPAGIEYINKGYDVPKLTKYLDWMNILSYDYHSAFEPAVNHHAPLYSLEEDNEYNYDAELNIDYTIKHYLKLGADPNKLVLGIPTYGRSYTLFNPDAFEIGSPADGPGDMGEATRENGYLAYYEICEYVKNQDWEVDEPNPNAMGPIAFKENQWVGYDDENIVRKKAEYVAENSLGGIMFWAIDNDDFRGNCHGKPYPLIEAGKEALLNAYGLTEDNLISPPSKPTKSSKQKPRTRTSKTTTTTTERPEENGVSSVTSRRRRIKPKSRDEDKPLASSAKRRKDSNRKSEATSTYSSLKVITPAYTTPAPPATPDTGGVFKCEDEGFFPHPKDCKKYFWCLGGPGDTGIVAHQFTCPAGLYFNKGADSCDYSQNVLCNKKLQKATTTTPKSETSTTESTTTQKPTPNSIFTTSRAPSKISKSTINFRTTTTTTTTEAYEDEYEDEDNEDERSKKEESEEDPRVIKELIDLIKKAGGIEELEKQLKFGKDGNPSTSSVDSTTPSGISKSLYERVLSKTSKNLNALKKISLNRNSGGPQGNDLQESKEKNSERSRPQYKTLTRQRPTAEKSSIAVTKEEDQEEAKEKNSFRTKSTLEYVNIRRPKASTTTEANDDDRNKILGELDEEEDEEEDEDRDNDEYAEDVPKKNNAPQYVNIRRSRPSTTETSASSSKYTSIRRSTVSPADDDDDNDDVDDDNDDVDDDEEEKNYKTIQRSSTTEPSSNSDESINLRYQTIRRGTTTTPTSVSKEDEETIRRRSTTVSSATSITTDSKYSSTRRSTTPSPAEELESTAKYQTLIRDSTTQHPLSSSEKPKPDEEPDSITETDLSSTKLSEDTITNNNIITTENIISSTQKETTESNSNVSSKTSNATSSDSLSETSEAEPIKKRPVLFQPRPFSIGSSSTAKPTTPEPTTVTSKVSQTNLRYRLKSNSASSSTTESPNSSTIRTRNRIRFSNVNRNLNEDTEQEEKLERIAENKPVRARKKTLIVTENPVEGNEEYNRKYRPAEIADLSSLTAVDLNLRGGEFVSNNRRRRPVTNSASSTTTKKPLEESEKTGSRTLTVARKAINVTAFGKSRRIALTSDDQLNASSDQTSTTRKIVRGFRSTTPIPATEDSASSTPTADGNTKVSPRTRKIIRRFRPSSTEATSTTEETLTVSTTPSSRRLQRKRIPLFRSRQNKNSVTPASTVTEKTESTESTFSTHESPLLKLFKTRSRFDISRNHTTDLKKEEDDDEDESSNEHTDVLNGEEGENIKLSESNIRESSKINAFGFDEKSAKRKISKSKASNAIQKPSETVSDTIIETTTDVSNLQSSNYISEKMSRTEPTRIIRTRKIIRKLNTISTTEPSTSTTAANLENSKNVAKKRKILRRLRPTIANDLEDKIKPTLNIKYRSEALTSTKPSPLLEEEITKQVFKPSYGRTTEKIPVEKENFELNKFRVFKPTTDRYLAESNPEYNLYSRPTSSDFDLNNEENDDYDENSSEENDDQEEDDDIDDENEDTNLTEDDIPKYTIYTTSSIERTHKFESNTNFNDEEEEDPEKNMKANKSISALILKTALNSRKESKTILDDTNGEELKEEEGLKNEEENKEDSSTTVVKVNHLLRPQEERPSFTRQRLALGTEELKSTSQQNLLKHQSDSGELLSAEPTMDSSITPISETYNTKVTENSSYLPLSETTQQIDITTLIINNHTEENDNTLATNDIIFTTTEELTETSTKRLTDRPLEISHPDEKDETTEDIIPTTTDAIITTQTTDEITKPTISNLTESTTEYHRRSTLRSIKDRPKLDLIRRTTESTRLSSNTEPTRKAVTRPFGKNRPNFLSTSKTPIKLINLEKSRSTSPLPLNKLLYKYSTKEKNTFEQKEIEADERDNEDEEEFENNERENKKETSQKINPIFSQASTTPKIFNEPIGFPKFIKPKFSKTLSSTPSTNEDLPLLNVDTEAVRNRNKNLFSKRKMNTPVIFSSTTPISNPPIEVLSEQLETTTLSSIQTDSTEPNLTTLHHVFAEIDDTDTTTESMNASPSTNPGKVERLIEVNRIVEVKTKQAKGKNHTDLGEDDTKVEITPTVDKIGEISRITQIKIVDGNKEAIIKDPESNEISTNLETTTHAAKNVDIPIEVAKVEEIPASKVIQNVSLKNFQFDIKMQDREGDERRDDRKFEIFGEDKVINSKELTNPSGKPEIIDGTSHINVVTPKPLQVTEASTISLQGLFQTERPHLNPNFASTDEVLETGRSEFVNVRVLDQDTGISLNSESRGSTNFIPVRVLRQDDEESTIKAHVMEISPKPNSRTIKIVPIKVEMSRHVANIKLSSKDSGGKA